MTETRPPKQIAADKVAELIEKLEKAEGPDRELDAQIWLETSPGVTRSTQHVVSATGAWPPYDIDETRDETGRLITVPYFTASLDAAVALMGRALPDWHYHVGGSPPDFLTPGIDKPFSAELMGPVTWRVIEREIGEEPCYDSVHASAETAPLALCLAILKAVRAHMHPRDREEAGQ